MKIKTTTIGAFPKPSCTPIGDWFPKIDDSDAKGAGKGLLQRWNISDYEQQIKTAADSAEPLFLQAIEEIILDQIQSGVDIPTDGEVRRENYIYYQCRQIDGIDFQTITRKQVRSGAFEAKLPTITGPLQLRKAVLGTDYSSAKQFTSNPVKITIPGPMTIADSIADEFYNDEKKLCNDLSNVLNQEILLLAKAGCNHIQVDEPVFARKPDKALSLSLIHI